MTRNTGLTIAALEAQIDALERAASQLRLITAQMRDDAVASAKQTSAPVKLLLSTREAAAYTGLSEWVIRKLARDGDLPAVRFGRSIRISRSVLDDYCRNLCGAGGEV